ALPICPLRHCLTRGSVPIQPLQLWIGTDVSELKTPMISRRSLLTAASVSLAATALAACSETTTTSRELRPEPVRTPLPELPPPALMYAAVKDGGHQIPAVPFEKIDKRFHRLVVADPSGERPGTV